MASDTLRFIYMASTGRKCEIVCHFVQKRTRDEIVTRVAWEGSHQASALETSEVETALVEAFRELNDNITVGESGWYENQEAAEARVAEIMEEEHN